MDAVLVRRIHLVVKIGIFSNQIKTPFSLITVVMPATHPDTVWSVLPRPGVEQGLDFHTFSASAYRRQVWPVVRPHGQSSTSR